MTQLGESPGVRVDGNGWREGKMIEHAHIGQISVMTYMAIPSVWCPYKDI